MKTYHFTPGVLVEDDRILLQLDDSTAYIVLSPSQAKDLYNNLHHALEDVQAQTEGY